MSLFSKIVITLVFHCSLEVILRTEEQQSATHQASTQHRLLCGLIDQRPGHAASDLLSGNLTQALEKPSTRTGVLPSADPQLVAHEGKTTPPWPFSLHRLSHHALPLLFSCSSYSAHISGGSWTRAAVAFGELSQGVLQSWVLCLSEPQFSCLYDGSPKSSCFRELFSGLGMARVKG